MKSLSTRLAVIIAGVSLCIVIIAGIWLDRLLTQVIEKQGQAQAELHAQSVLGSLKTLMLNGSGTMAQEWLRRLNGVAGIEDIEIFRRDGKPAFTDLNTVTSVNEYLGRPVFEREVFPPLESHKAVPADIFARALQGETVHDVSQVDQITIAMPIQADVECLVCHGYDSSMLRGVLQLSLSNQATVERVASMKNILWIGAVILVLLLGLTLWGALKINVLRPIISLRDAILKVGKGDLTTILPENRKDELGELAYVFNNMQRELKESESRISAVMDNVVDGIIIFTDKGLIESINPAVSKIFGYAESELLGSHVSVLSPESRRHSRATLINDDVGDIAGLGIAREIMGRRKNGTVFPMDVAVTEMMVGNVRYLIGSMRDITSRKARNAALRYQALHDALTDLPNRALLMDRLQQSLKSAKREHQQVALIFLDIDRFKVINDTLGHHVGDKLLQQIAQRLRLVLRVSDSVARLGGDEFCLLLPNSDTTQAMFTARKIISAIEKPIQLEGQNLGVGASLGISIYPKHGDTPAVLMQRADVAMYVAKRGKRGFSVYDPQKDQNSLRQLSMTNELQSAIDNDQLILHYQPKLDLHSLQVVGMEALVRWEHPKHGLLHPSEFVHLAEQTGLIQSLTRWVLRKAMKEYAHCQCYDAGLLMSINLSMRDLMGKDFPEILNQLVEEGEMSRSNLKLEITETALMEQPLIAIEAMERLNEMGLHLSIDDFGIGYSSLAYLKQLPVNELKIDKSFVQALPQDANSEVIVRSTIDLAHKLGMKVVAEGIESREVLNILTNLGCDIAQGFFISKPLALIDMLSWIETRKNTFSVAADGSTDL